jgi:hypothetical protein
MKFELPWTIVAPSPLLDRFMIANALNHLVKKAILIVVLQINGPFCIKWCKAVNGPKRRLTHGHGNRSKLKYLM